MGKSRSTDVHFFLQMPIVANENVFELECALDSASRVYPKKSSSETVSSLIWRDRWLGCLEPLEGVDMR